MTTSAPSTRSALERWSALAGVAYVVLFTVGVLLMENGAPDFDDPPDKVIKYWSDGGNRDQAAYAWGLVILGVFFLLWFVAALRQRMVRRDGDTFLASLVAIAGGAYAATTIAGISLEAGVLTMSDDTYQHQVFPELIHAARDAGYIMHVGGGAAIGALIIAASAGAIMARSVPAWAGWLGVVAGIVAIGSVFFLPLFVIVLWFLVVSIAMFLREPGTAARS